MEAWKGCAEFELFKILSCLERTWLILISWKCLLMGKVLNLQSQSKKRDNVFAFEFVREDR